MHIYLQIVGVCGYLSSHGTLWKGSNGEKNDEKKEVREFRRIFYLSGIDRIHLHILLDVHDIISNTNIKYIIVARSNGNGNLRIKKNMRINRREKKERY